VALLVTGVPLAVACVMPKDDYEDFLARTADARAALLVEPTVDASVVLEAALPEAGFGGTYYLSCLPALAQGDLKKTLNFQTTFQVVPAADGGSIATLSATALVDGATDLSQTVGAANMGSGSLDSNGVGDVIFPAVVTIPGAANPVQAGLDITIASGSDLKFYVTSATELCAGFGATITSPELIKLTTKSNPCVLRPFPQPSGPLPPLAAADYHCP
jgi:hypothetical protein